MGALLSDEGCVHISSFAGAHTHSLCQESSPTSGVCPELSSLMIDDIINMPLSCFVSPHDPISHEEEGCCFLRRAELNIRKKRIGIVAGHCYIV